jgi:hypothetical protein
MIRRRSVPHSVGYMELDRRGAELLFQVLTEREEKNSIAIASNESFSVGPKPSPTHACAPRSWTGSPLTAPSSKPVPIHTGLLPRSPERHLIRGSPLIPTRGDRVCQGLAATGSGELHGTRLAARVCRIRGVVSGGR